MKPLYMNSLYMNILSHCKMYTKQAWRCHQDAY